MEQPGIEREYLGGIMTNLENTTTDPSVSFIIPARDEERIIGSCLDAIGKLNYDHGLIECLLMDNGSLDGTANVAQAKGAKVLVLPDVTISKLRNAGAAASKGEFLAFVDADCVVDRDWVRNALRHFRDPNVCCVGSHPQIPERSTWVQKCWSSLVQNKKLVAKVDWLPSMNMLVRKKTFAEIGGFNEALTTCEDVDLCYRMRKKGYRIISDRAVRSVHFGEARTVVEFFNKERWRGQSNLRGLRSHSFYWQELPSLALPIFYLIAMASLPMALVAMFIGHSRPILIAVGLISLPALLIALQTSWKLRSFSGFARLFVLASVYALARAVAILPVKHSRRVKSSPVSNKAIEA